jgi:hypothetical protein
MLLPGTPGSFSRLAMYLAQIENLPILINKRFKWTHYRANLLTFFGSTLQVTNFISSLSRTTIKTAITIFHFYAPITVPHANLTFTINFL